MNAPLRDDALPSWSDGPTKTAILDFVRAITREGGPDFRPVSDRIAVFGNDGTLCCEQPLPMQVLFTRDRVESLADEEPMLRQKQYFKALLEHNYPMLQSLGTRGLADLVFSVEAGSTTTDFMMAAVEWMHGAIHPMLDRPFAEVIYQPQLELLALLRHYGFKSYIVTSAGANFVRATVAPLYGIPSEHVIGSTARLFLDTHAREGHAELVMLPGIGRLNDRETKVENLWLHVGRRPLLAFGNSDCDLAMLQYTSAGDGRRLALLLHHDDADREVAYDREYYVSPLDEALDRADELRIRVVSMRDEWEVVMRRALRGAGAGVRSVPRLLP